MLRKILLGLLIAVALCALALWWFTRPLPILTVTTWAGAYGRAQATAQMRPYAAEKHVDVHIAQYDGGLAGLRAAVTTRAYQGDVIDFELPDAVAACREGLLEPIDAARLPPGANGVAAAEDFVPGAVGPCWVGSVVYSQILIAAPGEGPRSLADFFDLAKFPGGRALRAGPKFNLELALLADGVAPDQVYPLLAREAGLARAFAKLDTIRPTVRWWTQGSEPIALVESGAAVMATALNGDVYDAQRRQAPLVAVWDRQLYEMDVFGVPKGDPNTQRAMDFIRHATGTAALARLASWVPYGPARHSALARVGDNPELKLPMAPYLPTLPAHFATAFPVDDGWWQDHGAAVRARWQAWLAGGAR
jgi:putative spermidine/putrescine transport system substrate-binding protein